MRRYTPERLYRLQMTNKRLFAHVERLIEIRYRNALLSMRLSELKRRTQHTCERSRRLCTVAMRIAQQSKDRHTCR